VSVMELPVLDGPMSFLELEDGQSVTYHPWRWDRGRALTAAPWRAPGDVRWTEVLRLHVPESEKPMFPHYVDAGQKTLIPQLTPLLPSAVAVRQGIRILAVGTGPKKRFSVELVP